MFQIQLMFIICFQVKVGKKWDFNTNKIKPESLVTRVVPYSKTIIMKDDVLFTYQFLKKDKRDDISSCPQKKKKLMHVDLNQKVHTLDLCFKGSSVLAYPGQVRVLMFFFFSYFLIFFLQLYPLILSFFIFLISHFNIWLINYELIFVICTFYRVIIV